MPDEAGTSSAGATTLTKPSSRAFEVFLNFRGPDSRYTVVDFIYDALVPGAGVRVFYDDESIRQGEVIGGDLGEAITNSKIYIPIFSKDYASSKWCLRELELIMEHWEASLKKPGEKKTILPIFYDVDVSTDLKLDSKVYSAALQKHKNELGKDVVKPWEIALERATEIKGWDIRNHGLAELTRLIVEEVCCELQTRSDQEKVFDDCVAIDNPIEDILELLHLDANDVRFVTIHGIAGVGKTTLARVVFNKISSNFQQRVAFLSNIREKSHTNAGIVDLQKELLLQLLQVNSSLAFLDANHGVEMIKDELKNKKVLIVLDDLNNRDQLKKLIGEPPDLGMGSRIIITTRNIGMIPNVNGFYRYKMKEMRPKDALRLFSKLVFKSDSPPEEFDEISREVVDITGRLPLAINVIGFLFSYNSKDAWVGILENLKKVVHKDVRERLMISYKELNNHEKEIFLDIACLFINKEFEDAIYYWKAQQGYPERGITTLENMSLIEIVDKKKLEMPRLLIDLGRNLVDEETNIHGRRSRLWSPTVALNVVCKKQGTEEVVALKLEKLDAKCNFNCKQFAGFVNLKFLELSGGNFEDKDFKKAFSELRWLSWDNCPNTFQATNLCFQNLDVLMLSEAQIIDNNWGGWREIQVAKSLKVLKCTNCRYLRKLPNFSTFPQLERLVLRNCEMLSEIDSSIGKLKLLTYLEITDPLHMKRLPDSIGDLKSLLVLKLKLVKLFVLPHSVGKLGNLKYLYLWCHKLRELPESVGNLKMLAELDISSTAITKLPESITNLECLKVIKCEHCHLENVSNKIKRLIHGASSIRLAKRQLKS